MIKEIIVQQVNLGEQKSGTKNGKSWTMFPIGLKVKDKWYNSATFKRAEAEWFGSLQPGQKIQLFFYKDQYQDKEGNVKTVWKFRKLTQTEELDLRLTRIEEKIDKIYNYLVEGE